MKIQRVAFGVVFASLCRLLVATENGLRNIQTRNDQVYENQDVRQLQTTQSPTASPTETLCSLSNLNTFDSSVPTETVSSFIAYGDIPYQTGHRYCLNEQLRNMSTSPGGASFIVHIGDIKPGTGTPCDDEAYNDIAEIITHPRNMLSYSPGELFFIPGDNEWTDCPDRDDAWGKWMDHFGPNNTYGFGTGLENTVVERQWNEFRPPGVDRSENFAFVLDKVLYVGLNLVGGPKMGDESIRHVQNYNWTRDKLAQYSDPIYDMQAAVVFGHAELNGKRREYFGEDFLKLIGSSYQHLPVAYVHGNGHHICVTNMVEFNNTNLVDIEVDKGSYGPPLTISLLKNTATGEHRFAIDDGGGRYTDGCPKGERETTWFTPDITQPPTLSPTQSQTLSPSTSVPTFLTPQPSVSTTLAPSAPPTTIQGPPLEPDVPTQQPSTQDPTLLPTPDDTLVPTATTLQPTIPVTLTPSTGEPTTSPTTLTPSQQPTTIQGPPLEPESPTQQPSPTVAPTSQPTIAPTFPPTQLPTATPPDLEFLADDAPSERYFGVCQGDCDSNRDCQVGLKCWKRDGYTAVPGCLGQGVWNKDYCYDPNTPTAAPTAASTPLPTVEQSTQPTPGNTLIPTVAPTAPLPELTFVAKDAPSPGFFGLCEGDCDRNLDCASGLLCFKRSEFTPVPGCAGLGRRNKDYCYDPSSLVATATANPTSSPTMLPTDIPVTTSQPTQTTEQPTDTQTADPTATPTTLPTTSTPTASPTLSPTSNPTATPTMMPTAQPTDAPTTSPTIVPTAPITPQPTTLQTSEPTSAPTAAPTLTQTVPPMDFPTSSPTVNPTTTTTPQPTTLQPTEVQTTQPTSTPTAAPSTLTPTAPFTDNPTLSPTPLVTSQPTNPQTASPTAGPTSIELTLIGNDEQLESITLGACQGDCDRDTDCSDGLLCFKRQGVEQVPGCTGSGTSGKDYCYVPPANLLKNVGNDLDPAEAFPLGECEGDCDRNSDCQTGLKCFKRSEFEAVPGCVGSGRSGRDYCYSPGAALSVPDDIIVRDNVFMLGE